MSRVTMNWMNPAGGLYYHWRALRYGPRLWTEYLQNTAQWLESWSPPEPGLILIGPSAGYSLPKEWLGKFKSIMALEIDPVARALFSHRHKLDNLTWVKENKLPLQANGYCWEPLHELLKSYPDHAILFSNLLGQLCLFAETDKQADSIPQSLLSLRTYLKGCNWASFHDRLSADMKPDIEFQDDEHRDDSALLDTYPVRTRLVVESHETQHLGVGLPCRYYSWERMPGYWHLIEACTSTPH